MLKRQILKSRFGRHYQIHLRHDASIPRSLVPLSFFTSHSARQFLAGLQVSQTYWRQLAEGCEHMATFRGHGRDHLQVVSDNLVNGRLRLYEVSINDRHLVTRTQRVIQDRRGDQYQFAPIASVLTTAGAAPRRFHSLSEVHEVLHDLAPNLEQLQTVVGDLQLAPAPQQLTYTQLVDTLADALAAEKVALYIKTPFKRPEHKPVVESAANLPGNRKVELAPPTLTSWVEIRLIDGKGEAIANEAYSLKCPEGKTYEGVTDAKGIIKLTGLKPGDCELTFKNIESSGLRPA